MTDTVCAIFFSQYIEQPSSIHMLHGFCVAVRGHGSPVTALPFWFSCFYSWQLFSLLTLNASHMIGQYHWGHWRQACTCVYSTWGKVKEGLVLNVCLCLFVCLLPPTPTLLSREHFMFAILWSTSKWSGAALPMYSTEEESCRCSEDGCPVSFTPSAFILGLYCMHQLHNAIEDVEHSQMLA